MKNKESLNYIKTAHRLEAVSTQIKANRNNQQVKNKLIILLVNGLQMAVQLKNLTPLLQQQANLDSIANVINSLLTIMLMFLG